MQIGAKPRRTARGQVCGLAALAGLARWAVAPLHGLGTGRAAGPPQAPLHQAQEARTAHAREPGPVEPLERGYYNWASLLLVLVD